MRRGVSGLRRGKDDILAWKVILSKVAQIEAKNISANAKVVERSFAALRRKPDRYLRLIDV